MRKQITSHPRITIHILFLLALAATILIGGYRLNWAWTGFTGEKETYRTFFDWLQLILLPLALAGFGYWFNDREQKAAEIRADKDRIEEDRRTVNEQKAAIQRADDEQKLALDNQREAALQAYIKEISELLLRCHLECCVKESRKQASMAKEDAQAIHMI
jgi:hypothetical protein